MPRTIRTKVYKFSELSESAKQKAIEKWRYRENDYSHHYEEITDSVRAVIELFNLKTGSEYTDIRCGHIDDQFLELEGVRLYKYLINNYYSYLFKPKYIKTVDRELRCRQFICSYFKNYEGKIFTQIHSKSFVDNSCVLTGMSSDDTILKPVYDFLSKPTNITFEELIRDIEHAIGKAYQDTEEWINSDEFIKEELEANEYEFYKDGSLSTL